MPQEHGLSNRSHSPLRWPGGKAKLTRFTAHTLTLNDHPRIWVEPYAGGAGLAVNLLLANRVDRIILNDLDPGVHAFWHTVLHSPGRLIDRIRQVPFDHASGLMSLDGGQAYRWWQTIHDRWQRNRYASREEQAFDFLMLNRMNMSGIINAGPIGGNTQTGVYNISSRFTKTTLIHRIEAIATHHDRITILHQDALPLLEHLHEHCAMEDCLVFIDPPYIRQGGRLYDTNINASMHHALAGLLCARPTWRWLCTYDMEPGPPAWYPAGRAGRFTYEIRYSANKRGRYGEYMFTSPRLQVESYDTVHLQPFHQLCPRHGSVVHGQILKY